MSKEESSNLEKSRQTSDQYVQLFRDVPALSSKELVSLIQTRHEKNSSNDFLIVDVRSKSEQSISMIPGSIPLNQFEQTHVPSPSTTTVIFYCTVGYRSGMTARYFQDKYSIPVKNLDGIVAYTHAISEFVNTEKKTIYMLKNPQTNEDTNRVHCYGKSWNYVDNHFEPVFFNSFHFLWKTFGVGLLTVWRSLQHIVASIHFYAILPNQR